MSDFYMVIFFASAVKDRISDIHSGGYAPLVKEGNRKNTHLYTHENPPCSTPVLPKWLIIKKTPINYTGSQ